MTPKERAAAMLRDQVGPKADICLTTTFTRHIREAENDAYERAALQCSAMATELREAVSLIQATAGSDGDDGEGRKSELEAQADCAAALVHAICALKHPDPPKEVPTGASTTTAPQTLEDVYMPVEEMNALLKNPACVVHWVEVIADVGEEIVCKVTYTSSESTTD